MLTTPEEKVNKAEERTYLSTNIGSNLVEIEKKHWPY
jgi:hypothetical protein